LSPAKITPEFFASLYKNANWMNTEPAKPKKVNTFFYFLFELQ
jgi:hypothetical protein